MNINLSIEVNTSSEIIAEKVVKSLFIDINTMSGYFDRSTLEISFKNSIIFLKIIAKDLTSAKASINTCLKWIENSINILENFS